MKNITIKMVKYFFWHKNTLLNGDVYHICGRAGATVGKKSEHVYTVLRKRPQDVVKGVFRFSHTLNLRMNAKLLNETTLCEINIICVMKTNTIPQPLHTHTRDKMMAMRLFWTLFSYTWYLQDMSQIKQYVVIQTKVAQLLYIQKIY